MANVSPSAPALLIVAVLAGQVVHIDRMGRISDIDNRGPVEFRLPGQGIEGAGHRVGTAVMSNII